MDQSQHSLYSTSGNGAPDEEYRRDSTDEIIRLIRRLVQATYLYTKELDRKHNVSAPQLSCLRVLDSDGPLPHSQLARRVMVKSSTITGIVDRLERKGFVHRVRTSPDRRVITIELTPEGRHLARNAPPPIQQQMVDGLNRLDPSQIEHIIRTLKILTSMLDTKVIETQVEQDDTVMSIW
ncbi:MAG: hypothetical protein AVO39_04535 [delta proteobacterium MLS_D]|jgi:DNA-binding MarR family transcriptional regulator|nr:MAG: hypothetical protein AVO39_04535 [delta proteobacterium MLS_D]